jgi:hypothetical protein
MTRRNALKYSTKLVYFVAWTGLQKHFVLLQSLIRFKGLVTQQDSKFIAVSGRNFECSCRYVQHTIHLAEDPLLINMPFVTDSSTNKLQAVAFENSLQHYKVPVT